MRHLDNASTSHPKPAGVVDAVARALRDVTGNPGRGSTRAARDAARVVESARASVAALLGVANPRRLAFTLNATDALAIALAGLARPGRRVLVGPLPHAAVSRPLARAGAGAALALAPDGSVDVAAAAADARDAACVVVTAASNVTGRVFDVMALARALAPSGAPLVVDAAQWAGFAATPLDDLGPRCVVALSGHKALGGPMGCGVLVVGDDVDLPPLRRGGGQDEDGDAAARLEAGTPPLPALAGLDAASRWWLDRGPQVVRAELAALDASLVGGLRAIDGVTLVGVGAPRVPVASFLVEGYSPLEVEALLDQEFGITVRAGEHCAPDAHAQLGTGATGTVRASLGPTSTPDDVQALLHAVREMTLARPR